MSAVAWTAVVLAGGPGTRARAIDASTPKPLLPIAGVPAVLRQVRWLARAGSCPPVEIAVVTGHEGERVASVLPGWIGAVPVTVVETEPEGTVAALGAALELARTDRVMSLNCDTLVACRLDDMLGYWPRAPQAMTVLCSASTRAPNRGEIVAEGGRLVRMQHPSVRLGHRPGPASTGIYLLSRSAVAPFVPGAPSGARIERYLANCLADHGLASVHSLGRVAIIDFGTPAGWRRLLAAEPTEFEILSEVT